MATRTDKSRNRAEAAQKGHIRRKDGRQAADIRRAESVGFHARGIQDWVSVDSLFSDPRYQRVVDMRRVERMAKEFDPDALGVIYVSNRGNGQNAVMDGFHRVALMRYLNWGDQKMPAFVFTGLTVQEEAEIFTRMNKDRKQPHPHDLFRSEVAAGRPEAVALNEVFTEVGIKVSTSPGAKNIRALATARRAFHIAGPDVVRRALKVLTKAWDRHDDAINGDVLNGLSLLLLTEPELIDDKHLAARLADFTPTQLVNKAAAVKDVIEGMTPAGAMAYVLTSVYNARRRNKRLAEFHYKGWPKVTPAGMFYGNGWSETRGDEDDDEADGLPWEVGA